MPDKAPRARTQASKRLSRSQYDARHRRLRLQLLATFPLCQYQGCCHYATEAHHKVYPAESLEDYLALCPFHHRLLHGNHS